MEFVNREKEIKYLNDYFANEPNRLIFVYGPKSSGKSTLLSKVLNSLDKKKVVINFVDLRGVLIYNFKTFLNTFFPKNLRGKAKQLLAGMSVNTGIFALDINEESLLEENAFKIMEKRLLEYNKKDIKPVIIIDEIQLLKKIYIDSDRMLIDELFNLFVRLTKVLHSAHIILATSDSYFIDEVYNNAKLRETTDLYLVDHFDKASVYSWLEGKQMPDDEIETVWKLLGGSPWRINNLLIDKSVKEAKTTKEICEIYVNDIFAELRHYVSVNLYDDDEIMFYEVISKITENEFCFKNEVSNKKLLNKLIVQMVDHDYWFYDVKTGKITANNKLLYWAFKKMIKNKK